MSRRAWLLADAAVKAALLGLLLYALARQNLPQYHDKAVGWRAVFYPIPALIVPAVWLRRGRRDRYAFDVDILIVLPFLIDAGGNALNLYDTVSWWDDLNHFTNWAILVAGFGRLLGRFPVRAWELFGLAVGFGAVTAILWELGEYLTFVHANDNELKTAYTDTLGDLTLGLTGSTLAAVALATAHRRYSGAGASS